MMQKLAEKGVQTELPLMPSPWAPNYQAYVRRLEECNINEETVLIGHSCGSAFLVRWLGETKRKVAKLILVAPWKIPDENSPEKVAFYTYEIDPSIAGSVGEIVMFTADNEEDDGKKSLEIFHAAIGGQVISLPGRGHYILDDMGTEKFPELLEVILDEGVGR